MSETKTVSSPFNSDPRHGLVLTAVGPDRPGLVKGLSAHIRKWGGNLEDTKMSKLGGEFAILMLVTGQVGSLAKIREALPQAEVELGLSCFVRSTVTKEKVADSTYRFVASGLDRPGIVESVSHVLAERQVNVRSLESRVDNAPLTGTPIFFLEAEIEIPPGIEVTQLEQELADACEREDLEFTLLRAL